MTSLPEIVNSDTLKPDPSPFPENAFVVRSIVHGWNATMGRLEWQLRQQSQSNQTQDRRYCVIDEKHPLFKAIVAADGRVTALEKDRSRDLLPTYRVVVKGGGRYCTIENYAALPIQKAEQQRLDDRAHFDALDDLRLELGLARKDADDLIRHNFSENEWWNVSAQAMRELAATKAARVKSTTVTPMEKHDDEPNEADKWFGKKEDRQVSELQDELTSVADEQAAQDKHWSQENNFYGKIAKRFQKRKASAIIKDYMAQTKEWFERESFTEFDMTEDAFFAMLDNELMLRFDTPKTDDAKKPSNLPAVESEAPTTPPSQQLSNAPANSSVENGDEPIIDKEQFRKKRTISISGQRYLKAADRVIMFRADHPDWTLATEALQLLPDFAVFKASIFNAEGRLLASGHGFCTPQLAQKVSGRFVEKAETAAIARALALLGGYGTDDSLDDSDYISDSPKAA